MSIFDDYRLRNILGGITNPSAQFGMADLNTNLPYSPDPGYATPASDRYGEPDVQNSMQDPTASQYTMGGLDSIFKPTYEAQNRLSEAINQQPKLSDYQPGKFKRVMAAIAGMGAGVANPIAGRELQDSLKYDDYNRAVRAWQLGVEPIGKLAQIENQKNVNERIIANDIMGRRIQQQRADEMERNNRAKNDLTEELRAIQERNVSNKEYLASIADYKAKHPRSIIKTDASGNLIAVDPGTNTAEPIKDSSGNVVNSGKLDDTTKMSIQLHNRLAAIEAQGAETRKSIGARESASEQLEGVKQPNRLELKQTPSGNARAATTDRPATPAAQNRDYLNRVRDTLNAHPEWKRYFETSPSGQITGGVKSPSIILPGHPNKETYDAIQKAIGAVKQSIVAPRTPPINNAPIQTPSAPAGRVNVYDKSGKFIGTIPAADVPRLNTDKYMVK